jgi:type VI secretion system protein ImpA
LDGLLKSFGEDTPSGENLEYESVFTDLEMVAQPKEERQMGDEVIAAEEPNYREISEKALAVLEQSHDLRAAVLMAGAELRMNGFEGFAKVTTYIRGCLEEFWDSCHPQLDEDDDNDPTMRVNAILGLSDDATIVKSVRNAPLTLSNAFGRITLRDISVADGEIAPAADATNVLDPAGISAAFQDTDDDALALIFESASTALDNVKAIDAVFNTQTPGQGPDLSPLIKTLHRVVKRLAQETGEADVAGGEDEAEEDGGAAAGGAVKSAPSGAITSPRDVEMALDRVLAYYVAYEPSSPLPLLLQRAKRLVGADFMTIMKDIAPSGVDNVMVVGGLSEDDD